MEYGIVTSNQPRPSTRAVIVHFGPLAPTVRLIGVLSALAGVDSIAVVANDLQPRPSGLALAIAWIVPPRNLGFGGGFDHAFRTSARADYYILLNNDVELTDECIAECQRALAYPAIGVVGPILVNSHGLQSGVGRITHPLFKSYIRRHPDSHPICDAEWITGAVMFIKRRCYEETGFNVSYFLTWEDVELCFRVRDRGWRVAIAARAKAWHEGGSTIPTTWSYYSTRNRVWFARQRGARAEAGLVWCWMAVAITARLFAADLLKRRSTLATRCHLHGLVDGLMDLPGRDVLLPGEPRPDQWLRTSRPSHD